MRTLIDTLVVTLVLTSAAFAEPLYIATDTVLDGPQAGGVVVASDGVTLDCAHHLVQGDGIEAIGIEVLGDDVTLSNCVVDQFSEVGVSARLVERLTLRNVGVSRVDVGLLVEGGAGHMLDAVYVAVSRIGVRMIDVRASTAVGITVDAPTARGVVLSSVVDSDLVGARVLRAGARGISVSAGYGVTVRDSVDLGVRGNRDRRLRGGAAPHRGLRCALERWRWHPTDAHQPGRGA